MRRLAILGASGHGTVVADAALAAGWHDVIFFDDSWPSISSVGPWPVVGGAAELLREVSHFEAAVVAIGANVTRLDLQRALIRDGVVMTSVIHPAAVVSSSVDIGSGTVVCAGAVVNPFARVGYCCIVNTCASVDHDCDLADGVHVSPGAHLGGGVRVGEASWIGIGATVSHGIVVGPGVTVGAGTVVVRDVAGGSTVVGVPARSV